MANKFDKSAGNIPGHWYVDSTCIDCDLCRSLVPGIFERNADIGVSVVIRQPVTAAEIELTQQAQADCPSDSIGNDGE